MPTSDTPLNEPQGPTVETPHSGRPEPDPTERVERNPESEPESIGPAAMRSRWVDYDTHELLSMISELEDERRWARLREGIWLAILAHLIIVSALTWIPKYVFKVPAVSDRNEALKRHEDFTYLDTPKFQPKVEVKPVPVKPPTIDKKTLDEMNKAAPQPAPAPAPQQAAPAPAAVPPPVPPSQQSQSPVEAPRPAAVPARPNFSMNSQNPADQLREAMKGASHNPGQSSGTQGGGGLALHPGAGSGVEILSDTQGVDFNSYIRRVVRETQRTWDPLIPDEVNPPINKAGTVMIRFKILPDGRPMEGSMVLEGRSGDSALDRAAWGSITGSNYPSLPREFHGPYLELRFLFLYNTELPR
jgi:outer membrane biosynthesis protein TonB